MSKDMCRVGIAGHVTIEDDEGRVVLDKDNAIHPQNISRIIARALAHEPNSTIYKIALGNGGTFIDATGDISFRRPNDGVFPDIAGWQSRLYNETYNEIVDESSPKLGTGASAYPGGDPAGVGGVVSQKLPSGEAQIVVTCTINSKEPTAQLANSLTSASSINGMYTFDELALFTSGLPPVATQGYQDVLLTTGKTYTDITYLTPGQYAFSILVDPVGVQQPMDITITIPSTGGTGANGAVTYNDLVAILNAEFALQKTGCVAQINQPGVDTLGNLRFRSITTGAPSSVALTNPANPPANWLFKNLLQSADGSTVYGGLGLSVVGQPQGEEDNPYYPQNERERMLTHLIFAPLQKDATRSWKITYKLTVVVLQSDQVN